MESLVAIMIVANNKLLVEVRKQREEFGANAVWIPGGHIEKGETPEKAMLREAREEFGIIPTEYKQLCEIPWKKNSRRYLIIYFVCNKWVGNINPLEAEEVFWLNKNEVNKLDEKVDRKAHKNYFCKLAPIRNKNCYHQYK